MRISWGKRQGGDGVVVVGWQEPIFVDAEH